MMYRRGQRAECGDYSGHAALQLTPRCQNVQQWPALSVSCTVWFITAILLAPLSDAYTLDLTSPTVIRPEKSVNVSMFGYTLAFWHEEDSSRSLLVGAPDWDDAGKQGGALFKCSLDKTNPSCQIVLVDNCTKTCKEERCEDISKSQRLGATLAVHEDIVLVCAPNWSYTYTNKYNKKTGTPVGKCFYSANNNMKSFKPFSAAYDVKNTTQTIYYFTTGFCQAGFSALLLPEEQKVALGSPGCYAWTGDVLVGEPGNNESYTKKGETYHPSDDFGVTSSSKTGKPYNRYLGYSIARGTFGDKLAVVAGAPKESSPYFMQSSVLNSSVSVMEGLEDDSLTIVEQLKTTLDQGWYFSYCGYSVAVGDLNGDGLDDIAVGCPNYDDDKGAVLVYYQTKETDGSLKMRLEDPEYRTGSETGARFGSFVTVLGDIDGDGFQELAVGSPFTNEGVNGTGRLYIYCSTRGQDLPKKPCQEVASPAIRNFGWSATAHSSAVAVSAPSSDVVLVYSTRTVVQLDVSVETPNDLDVSQLCPTEGGDDVPCVIIRVCLQYTMRNGPNDDKERDMNVDVELEASKALTFGDNTKSQKVNFRSKVGAGDCKELEVYDKKKSEDIVEYEINAKGSFTPSEDDSVVFDDRSGLDSTAMLRMKVDCKDSTYETCLPDMKVSIQKSGHFVLRDKATVQLNVTLTVSGDPAYYPKLVVSSAGFMASSSSIVVEGAANKCSEDSVTHDISCSLGGILQNTKAIVILNMTGSVKFYANLKTGDDYFTVVVAASCSSSIEDPSAGNATARIDISVEPKLLELTRSHDAVGLDLSKWDGKANQTLESKGPKLLHTYQVSNPNEYHLYGVSLTIYWPQKHKEGYLLYTSQAPTIMRGGEEIGQCVAVAGGGFDEENLYDSNRTDTEISTKASPTVYELGSGDIQQLEIRCNLGEMGKEDNTIVVAVESYAFSETFDKLTDSKVSPIKSVAVAKPSSAALGKIFINETVVTISSDVTYLQAQTQWWWIIIAVLVGLVILVAMVFLFCKMLLVKKTLKGDEVDGVNEEEEMGSRGGDEEEEGGYEGEEEPLNSEENEETLAMNAQRTAASNMSA